MAEPGGPGGELLCARSGVTAWAHVTSLQVHVPRCIHTCRHVRPVQAHHGAVRRAAASRAVATGGGVVAAATAGNSSHVCVHVSVHVCAAAGVSTWITWSSQSLGTARSPPQEPRLLAQVTVSSREVL